MNWTSRDLNTHRLQINPYCAAVIVTVGVKYRWEVRFCNKIIRVGVNDTLDDAKKAVTSPLMLVPNGIT